MIILKKRFRFKEGVTKVIYFHQEFLQVFKNVSSTWSAENRYHIFNQ